MFSVMQRSALVRQRQMRGLLVDFIAAQLPAKRRHLDYYEVDPAGVMK